MNDELRNKIQIRPRPKSEPRSSTGQTGQTGNFREIEEIKADIKRLKKHLGRIINTSQHEDTLLSENKGKSIILQLMDGKEATGKLEDITKFQMVLEVQGLKQYFFKSAIVSFYFEDSSAG